MTEKPQYEYICSWNIEVTADSVEEAAEMAEELMSERLQSSWLVTSRQDPDCIQKLIEVVV